MAERSITRIVGEGQYGIIAPERDLMRVDRLVTFSIFQCFALGIFDSQAKVGLFAHLGHPHDLIAMQDQIPSLLELGAKEVVIQTMGIDNLAAWGPEHFGAAYAFKIGREMAMEALVAECETQKLKVTEGKWQELGYQPHAAFIVQEGLRAAHPEQLVDEINNTELQRALRFQQALEEAVERRDPAVNTPICAYQPRVVI